MSNAKWSIYLIFSIIFIIVVGLTTVLMTVLAINSLLVVFLAVLIGSYLLILLALISHAQAAWNRKKNIAAHKKWLETGL